MTDIERILALRSELEAAGADYVLGTVTAVEGSTYRKPGALILLSQDGRRAGTVSGGCLEDEIARRAWWLTADGPSLQRYSTIEEDGDRPYGSGCGGVVWLLLERRATAGPLLDSLAQSFSRRTPLAVATILEGEQTGRRAFAGFDPDRPAASIKNDPLQQLAERALESRTSFENRIEMEEGEVRAWAEWRPARPGLWIFGAGNDAQPVHRLARELGWFVTVADGRSQLVSRARFPRADELCVLQVKELPQNQSASPFEPRLSFHRNDAAVVMTHSFEQDSRVLATLLALENPLAYIGVLGPQRRTRELLAEAARLLDPPANSKCSTTAIVERWLEQLHAPTGLDLGAGSPEVIALSIVAEIQKTFAAATALPMRQVRAATPAIAR